MKKIIMTMQVSLDGIVSEVEKWAGISDEIINDSMEYYNTLDAIITGGRTYPSLAKYWQNAEKNSDSVIERKFAKRINEIKKIVFSRNEKDLVWNNSEQLLVKDSDDLKNKIEKIKAAGTGNISVESGAGAWKVFLKKNLFDEICIWMHPVIAAKGEKLFDNLPARVNLKLEKHKIYKEGVVLLQYQKIQRCI